MEALFRMKNKLTFCKQFLASNKGTLFFFLTPLATFLMVEVLEFGGSNSECMLPNSLAFWVNLLFYYGVFLLFRAVTGRTRFSIIFPNLVFLIFAIINHYSIAIRNAPVVPWDLYAAGTAVHESAAPVQDFDAIAETDGIQAALYSQSVPLAGKGRDRRGE